MTASEILLMLQETKTRKKLSCRKIANQAGVNYATVQSLLGCRRKNIQTFILVDIIHALGYEIEIKEIEK